MIEIRGSRGDQWSHCGASTVAPQVRVVTSGEEAALGTAVHHVIRWAIEKSWNEAEIEEQADAVANTLDVDLTQLLILSRMAMGFWRQLAEHFPEPVFEYQFPAVFWSRPDHNIDNQPEITLTGQADLVSLVDKQIRILDWKSGYGDYDHRPQGRAYARSALEELPDAESVYFAVLNIRSGNLEPYQWARQEVLDWWERTARTVIDQETFRPGDWCRFCPRALECPALLQAARSAAVICSHVPEPLELSPEMIGRLYDGGKLLAPILERSHGLVKAHVAASGGVLPLGDGRELWVKEEERKEIQATPSAIGEMHEATRGAAPETILKVRKGELEKAVRAIAPPRQGAKQFRTLMEKLATVGAVQTTWVQKLEVRRSGPTQERVSNDAASIESASTAANSASAAGAAD
jgi:hypothetical protein